MPAQFQLSSWADSQSLDLPGPLQFLHQPADPGEHIFTSAFVRFYEMSELQTMSIGVKTSDMGFDVTGLMIEDATIVRSRVVYFGQWGSWFLQPGVDYHEMNLAGRRLTQFTPTLQVGRDWKQSMVMVSVTFREREYRFDWLTQTGSDQVQVFASGRADTDASAIGVRVSEHGIHVSYIQHLSDAMWSLTVDTELLDWVISTGIKVHDLLGVSSGFKFAFHW